VQFVDAPADLRAAMSLLHCIRNDGAVGVRNDKMSHIRDAVGASNVPNMSEEASHSTPYALHARLEFITRT
jgi:hypothetical protein